MQVALSYDSHEFIIDNVSKMMQWYQLILDSLMSRRWNKVSKSCFYQMSILKWIKVEQSIPNNLHLQLILQPELHWLWLITRGCKRLRTSKKCIKHIVYRFDSFCFKFVEKYFLHLFFNIFSFIIVKKSDHSVFI